MKKNKLIKPVAAGVYSSNTKQERHSKEIITTNNGNKKVNEELEKNIRIKTKWKDKILTIIIITIMIIKIIIITITIRKIIITIILIIAIIIILL